MSSCSHQDESRRSVGDTAFAVACARGMEFDTHGEDALFHDPYATLLAVDIGMTMMKTICAKRPGDLATELERLVAMVAVRTRKLDDEIVKGIHDNFRQICIVGAGLDTRAWRLQKNVEHPVSFFEIDFPEIFEHKLTILKAANASTCFDYHAVCADLSIPEWHSQLTASGFDVTKPTLWLLEGLIGYLTEEEANSMFRCISSTLSAKNSRIIATFVTRADRNVTSMHRFFPPNPLDWVKGYGWMGEQDVIENIAPQYGRKFSTEVDATGTGYYVLVADLKCETGTTSTEEG